LDLAGAGGGCGDDACGGAGDYGCGLAGCVALRGAGGDDDLVRRGEVGVVEDVEELGAELGVETLAEPGGFVQREVEVGEVGADEGVATEVAEGSIGRCAEGGGVEKLLRRMRVEIAVEVGVDVGADRVAGVSAAGGVVAELRREREAGLDSCDGAQRPAADGAVGEAVEVCTEAVVCAEGKIVSAVDGGEVADVAGGGAVVEFRVGRVHGEGGRVGTDAGVPCGAVVEVLRPGVVAAELEAVGEAAVQVYLEGVVVADAAGDP